MIDQKISDILKDVGVIDGLPRVALTNDSCRLVDSDPTILEPKIIDLEYHNHPLSPVFMAAIEQATKGKGVRHGGDNTPFLEQPWMHYAQLHGRGFLTGQAAKKLEEAASIKKGDAFVNEALGAIIYMAMSIIYEQQKERENGNNLG